MTFSRSTLSTILVFSSVVAGCGGSDDPVAQDASLPQDANLPAEGGLGGQDAGSMTCMPGSTGGGGATGGMAGTIPATFETVKLVLGGGSGIMPCSAAPCHGVNGMAPPEHPLELPPTDDQKLYSNLLSYVSAACNNTKLVDPCRPAQSALVTILKGACGSTPRMPYGCTPQVGDCIPDDYIAAVEKWIANGAPRQ